MEKEKGIAYKNIQTVCIAFLFLHSSSLKNLFNFVKEKKNTNLESYKNYIHTRLHNTY